MIQLWCSMQKDDFIRVQHMLDAAREAIHFAGNKTRSSLDTDRKLALALVKSIEIIGEAAANESGTPLYSYICSLAGVEPEITD